MSVGDLSGQRDFSVRIHLLLHNAGLRVHTVYWCTQSVYHVLQCIVHDILCLTDQYVYIVCMTLYDILYYIYCCMLINEIITNHSIQCSYQHSVAKDG